MTETAIPSTPETAVLPEGWKMSSVGELYRMVGGGTPTTKKPEYWDGDIPWISSADIHGLKDVTPRRSVSEEGIANSATNLVPGGSLLVVTRVGLGKVAIAPEDLCFSQDSQALIGKGDVLPDYALYYLSEAVQEFKHQGRGTTISGVTKKQLAELPFILPPLAEQRRIVEKIEELFTRLDAGVESLEKTKALLKKYRQSVLKAAVTGELSREWRDDNGELEPAAELLKRILEERREKWIGKKYKEPVAPDASNLPALPEGWEWATVEQLASVGTGATPLKRNRAYYEGGNIPWVTSGALNGLFIEDCEQKITELALKETNAKLFPKHTLLVAMYGEGKTRGKVSELLIEAATNQACASLSFEGIAERSRPYVKLFFEKNYDDIRRLSSGGVQPNLNLSIVKSTAIPLPPLEEQNYIVGEVERRLSVEEKLEATIEENMRRSGSLRQSILKRAFLGKLVGQNAEDESAGVLLERIREERAGAKAGKSRHKKTAKNDESLF